MTAPAAQLLCNKCVVSAKEHELHIRIHAKTVAIFLLESGAGQHRVLARSETPLDLPEQTFQPRPSVFVRQRMTAAHLLHIFCRMKIVRFIETPAKFVREQFTDRCLSRTRDAENNDDHDT